MNGSTQSDSCPVAFFITWTTYGTWLPGDPRGWRKMNAGEKLPQPKLYDWCSARLTDTPVFLSGIHREKVAAVIRQHAEHRNWRMHALAVRSNHIHIAIEADAKPETVTRQLKANATRVLRFGVEAIVAKKIWTSGGYAELVYTDDELEDVMTYINESQDNWVR